MTSKPKPQSPQTSSPSAPPSRTGESITCALTFKLERLVPASQFEHVPLEVQDDPRFVIVGFAIASEPPLFAPDIRQAFAVHDLESLGLNGAHPGDTVDFILFGTPDAGAMLWRLAAAKPH